MKGRTRASGAAIALRNDDGVICRASSGEAPPVRTPLNLDSTVTGECYRSGNIVSITDTEKDARVDADLCGELGFRSLLIVPVAAGDEVLGILEVFSPVPGNFEGGDVLLLGSIAEVAAEIYGAEQRKPNVPTSVSASAIPFLVSDRVEQIPQDVNALSETNQESNPPALDAAAAPKTEGHTLDIRSGKQEAAPSVPSYFAETSEDVQSEDHQNRWKPRTYLLLMAGLSILGIGMGDIVDWHMTSRLARSSVQSAAAPRRQSSPLTAASGLGSEDAHSLPSSSPELATKTRIIMIPQPIKKPIGAKFEKSSFVLKNAIQGVTSAPLAGDSQNTVSLTRSEAVPLARSVPNLDSKITSQLTPAKLLHRVDPVVPDFAKSAGLDETVLLSAVIGIDGKLKEVKFVSGDRALAIEAFRAVCDWRYRPYMLNGKPIEAETRIVMNFKP